VIENMTSPETYVFRGNRVVASHNENIKRSPEKIFALLCPVQEYKWIDKWDCEIIYSDSRGVENNCIFKEQKTGPVLFECDIPTYWTVSYYDQMNFKVQFVLMSDHIAITKIDVDIKDIGPGRSSASWAITITAMCEEANNKINKSTKNKANMYLTVLGKSLKHYCENGEMLSLNKANLVKMGFSVGVLDVIKNHLKGLSSK
jgi:hypothetical protein